MIRSDGVIELNSNITEDTVFDEQKPVLKDDQEVRQAGPEPKPLKEKTSEENMLEAVMGFAGGEGWIDKENWTIYDHISLDDPFAPSTSQAIASAMKVKFDDRLWDAEEMKTDEIPEELKESGAINVKLSDVRNTIGKDRAQWKLALESELKFVDRNRCDS